MLLNIFTNTTPFQEKCTIRNSLFHSIYSEVNGGAIYSKSSLILINVVFHSCISTVSAGAVYASDDTYFSMVCCEDCYVDQCPGTEAAEAVYVGNYGDYEMNLSSFVKCNYHRETTFCPLKSTLTISSSRTIFKSVNISYSSANDIMRIISSYVELFDCGIWNGSCYEGCFIIGRGIVNKMFVANFSVDYILLDASNMEFSNSEFFYNGPKFLRASRFYNCISNNAIYAGITIVKEPIKYLDAKVQRMCPLHFPVCKSECVNVRPVVVVRRGTLASLISMSEIYFGSRLIQIGARQAPS